MLSTEIHLVTNMCLFNDIQSHFHKMKEQRLFFSLQTLWKILEYPRTKNLLLFSHGWKSYSSVTSHADGYGGETEAC